MSSRGGCGTGRGAIELVLQHAAALARGPEARSRSAPAGPLGQRVGRGRLSFSWRLVMAPPEALETVVVHELAHLRVFGHGPYFWSLVASRRPDHVTWRRWLHDHSAELHAALDGGATGSAPPASVR